MCWRQLWLSLQSNVKLPLNYEVWVHVKGCLAQVLAQAPRENHLSPEKRQTNEHVEGWCHKCPHNPAKGAQANVSCLVWRVSSKSARQMPFNMNDNNRID